MSRYLDKLVGVWAGLLGLAYIPYLPSNAVVGRWVILEVGAALLFCLIRVRWTLGHTLGAVLLLYMLVSSFLWSASSYDSIGGFIQWFFGFGLAFCIGCEVKDTRPFWWGLLLGVLTSLPFALAQKLGYSPVWVINHGTFGTYLSEQMAAEAGVLGVVAVLVLRQWWFLPLPLSIAYLAGSRTTYPALVAVFAVWAWNTFPEQRRLFSVSALVLVLALGGVYVFGLHPGWFRVWDRLEIWTYITQHTTLLGYGLGSLVVFVPEIEFAHNEVLHYAFELGIGSLFLWALVCYALQGKATAELMGLVAVLVFAAVWFPFHEPLTGFVAALCAGYLYRTRSLARVQQPVCRVLRVTCPEHDDRTPLGVGALQFDDLSRPGLPLGPQHSLGWSDVSG